VRRRRLPGGRHAWSLGVLLVLIGFLPGCALIERVTHNPWLSFAFNVVNFAILVSLLVKFLSKPLGTFLKRRQAEVKKALEEAERARSEAEKKAKEYEARLARMDEEIQGIHQALREEGEREKARLIREAEQMAEKIREQAQVTARQEIRAAQRVLREEMADLAVRLAEEIVKRGITEADQKRLVEEYIDQMEALR